MRKLCAGLLAALLLGLCACGRAGPEETEAGTTMPLTVVPQTTEVVTLPPNDPPSRMNPELSGPILYVFYSKNLREMPSGFAGQSVGLINQDGELVAAPQYDIDGWPYYYLDENGHIEGFILSKGMNYYIYDLYGNCEKIAEKCYGVNMLRGGRYAILDLRQPAPFDPDGPPPAWDGIYDLREKKYIFAPEEGQVASWYGYNPDNLLLVKNAAGRWVFDSLTGTMRQLAEDEADEPLSWCGQFIGQPEIIEALDGWGCKYNAVDRPYGNKEYALINHWDTDELAFLSREGKIVDRGTYTKGEDHGGFFEVTDQNGAVIWLDGSLRELGRLQKGEQRINLVYPGSWNHIILDAAGNPIRGIDKYGQSLQANGVYEQGHDVFDTTILYRLKDGKWTKLDLSRYGYATAGAVCEDFVVVCVRERDSMTSPSYLVDMFAVDWGGNKVDNCPLAPLFPKKYPYVDYERMFDGGHGWRWENNYWIENEELRGFVNIKGEWLFVDTTGK